MKALFITAALMVAGAAHANVTDFSCIGRTNGGDVVEISGQFENNGGGDYSMLGNLTVSGTDGEGNSLFSGGGAGTERFFAEENVTLRSTGKRGYFNLNARSSNGSVLTIRHKEMQDGGDYILVDLQPTRTKGYYNHEFNRARCTFN